MHALVYLTPTYQAEEVAVTELTALCTYGSLIGGAYIHGSRQHVCRISRITRKMKSLFVIIRAALSTVTNRQIQRTK